MGCLHREKHKGFPATFPSNQLKQKTETTMVPEFKRFYVILPVLADIPTRSLRAYFFLLLETHRFCRWYSLFLGDWNIVHLLFFWYWSPFIFYTFVLLRVHFLQAIPSRHTRRLAQSLATLCSFAGGTWSDDLRYGARGGTAYFDIFRYNHER